MQKPFLEEEVKKVVFESYVDGTPGPDWENSQHNQELDDSFNRTGESSVGELLHLPSRPSDVTIDDREWLTMENLPNEWDKLKITSKR